MRRAVARSVALAVSLHAATGAHAGMIEDYNATLAQLGPALGAGDAAADLQATSAMIAGLAGILLPLSLLAGQAPLKTGTSLPTYCGKSGLVVTVEPDGDLAFRMHRPIGGRTATEIITRFDYRGRGLFQRQVATPDLMAFLFPQGLDKLPPEVVLTTLAGQAALSLVTVFQPKPDILVLLSPGQPAEIWGRCP